MTITYESRIIRKRKKLQIDRLFLILEEKSIIRIYNDITLSQKHRQTTKIQLPRLSNDHSSQTREHFDMEP